MSILLACFKVEFTGQIARRIKKELSPKICEEIFAELVFINISRIFEEALFIARETGSRAADLFYIACAKREEAILISNDKHQIESAKKSGIEVYNLLHDQELVKKRLIDAVFDMKMVLTHTYTTAISATDVFTTEYPALNDPEYKLAAQFSCSWVPKRA